MVVGLHVWEEIQQPESIITSMGYILRKFDHTTSATLGVLYD